MKVAYSELYELSSQLSVAELGTGALPVQRMLINAGFMELPPAGYLPVAAGKVAIEEQLARIFGEGVVLHYHAVRADEIAHLLSEAQHLDRISLTRGIDNPAALEEVEIFVPDGQVIDLQAQAAGTWWQVDMRAAALTVFNFGNDDGQDQVVEQTSAPVSEANANFAAPSADLQDNTSGGATNSVNSLTTLTLSGMARTEARDKGSYALTLATSVDAQELADLEARRAQATRLDLGRLSVYLAGDVGNDPFDLGIGDAIEVKAELRLIIGSCLLYTSRCV